MKIQLEGTKKIKDLVYLSSNIDIAHDFLALYNLNNNYNNDNILILSQDNYFWWSISFAKLEVINALNKNFNIELDLHDLTHELLDNYINQLINLNK